MGSAKQGLRTELNMVQVELQVASKLVTWHPFKPIPFKQ